MRLVVNRLLITAGHMLAVLLLGSFRALFATRALAQFLLRFVALLQLALAQFFLRLVALLLLAAPFETSLVAVLLLFSRLIAVTLLRGTS